MSPIIVKRQPDLSNFAQRIYGRVENVMDEVMREAADLMRVFIGSRGTGETWSKPWNGREGSYPGRVASGEMQGAVDFEIKLEDTAVVGKFGWTEKRQPYFLMQDRAEGFWHVLAMRQIPGMEALADSGLWAEGEIVRRLTAQLKSL